jgi:MFS family permease
MLINYQCNLTNTIQYTYYTRKSSILNKIIIKNIKMTQEMLNDRRDTKSSVNKKEYLEITSQKLSEPLNRRESTTSSALGFRYNKFKTYMLTINASAGFFFVGYTIGVFDTILPELAKLNKWDESQEMYYSSLISSAVGVGAILGSFISGYILNKFGRRKSFFIADIVAAISIILTLFNHEYIMIFGRFISGLCVGGFMNILPVYINEFVPYEISGSCGAVYELHFCFGVFISYILGFGFPEEVTENNQLWRIMVALPIVFLIFNFLGLLFIFRYDTPKYLYLNKNDIHACRESLYTIYFSEVDVGRMMANYEQIVTSDNSKISFTKLFSKKYRIRFIVCLCIIITQQACGIDVYFMYSQQIFLRHNPEKFLATIITNLIGISQLVAGIIAIFVTDKIGRRSLLVQGQLWMVINSAAISVLYYFGFYDIAVYFYIPLVFLNGVTLSPVAFIYCTEVLPNNAYTLGIALNNLANVAVTQTYPYLSKSVLEIEGTLLFYTGFIMINLVLCVLFAKETKDLSPYEIDVAFSPKEEVAESIADPLN